MNNALVLGAGGFIGAHLVKRLKREGYYVVGVDIHFPDHSCSAADEFFCMDLRNCSALDKLYAFSFTHVFQLAADMGGAGYIFSQLHDADIMYNSSQINLNVLRFVKNRNPKAMVFFSSSACIYPLHNQQNPLLPNCKEESAYPANPDSDYGWEKLFSERLYLAFHKNYGLNIRIARFHNVFGPEGEWKGGKEKAPAALCRKVATAKDGEEIEVWGSGNQTRSFLYIDDCIDGIMRITATVFHYPVNLGSEEMISIDDLAQMVIRISKKKLTIVHTSGPVGVLGRVSDNALLETTLGWKPTKSLEEGIARTYEWIDRQLKQSAPVPRASIFYIKNGIKSFMKKSYNEKDLVEEIYRSGYCVIDSYFTEDECKSMNKLIFDYVKRKGSPRNFGQGTGIHPFFEKISEFKQYIFSADIISLLRAILRDTPMYTHSGAMISDSDSNEILANWHNHYGWDMSRLRNREAIERVLLVTYPNGADEDSGNLIVIPRGLNDPLHSGNPDELVARQEMLNLNPGSIVIFDSAMWHCAKKGRNIQTRIIIGAHFQAKSVELPHADNQFEPYEVFF